MQDLEKALDVYAKLYVGGAISFAGGALVDLQAGYVPDALQNAAYFAKALGAIGMSIGGAGTINGLAFLVKEACTFDDFFDG